MRSGEHELWLAELAAGAPARARLDEVRRAFGPITSRFMAETREFQRAIARVSMSTSEAMARFRA